MSPTITDLAGAYSKAWASHDADAVAALHTKDSVFHVHGLGAAATGVEMVRQLTAGFFALVPDLLFTPKRVYIGPDHLVFEYDMSGTTAGKPFVCDGVDVIAFRDGLVARKDTYLDMVGLQRQVGALPDMA